MSGPTLTDREQEDLRSAMRETVPDDFAPLPMRTIVRRTEWRDVPGVVAAAAARHEMAVRKRTLGADKMRFELATLDDRPVTITALRDAGGAIRFEARVGLLGRDVETADALVATATALMNAGVPRVSIAEMLADPPFATE